MREGWSVFLKSTGGHPSSSCWPYTHMFICTAEIGLDGLSKIVDVKLGEIGSVVDLVYLGQVKGIT